MYKVYLLLGSNLGDKLLYLSKAVVEIDKRIGQINAHSSLYETEPWGFSDKNTFINMVVEVQSPLSPNKILERINAIETNLGRKRTASEEYQSRNIDIDILFYGDEIIDKPDLQIPHPRLHERRFTLEPLNELIPDRIHPGLQKNIRQLLKECDDKLEVKKISR